MKIRVFILFCLAVAAVLSCKSRKEMNIPTDNSPLIEMQMHGCRGFCPTYKLSFRNNGELIYEGLRNVEQAGVVKTGITPEELAQLRERVTAVNLWQYPEQIESRVADAPSSTMTVHAAGKTHSVSGSIDRPKPILDLENRMKDLAELHGLRVKKGIDPNAMPENSPEVIVKLKDGVNAGNWIEPFKQDLNLRLKGRVSAENLWRIAYDPAQIGEKALLDRLKSDKDVLEAQANNATKDRN